MSNKNQRAWRKRKRQARPQNHTTNSRKFLKQHTGNPPASWVSLFCIIILSVILNTTALDWGQTGEISWSPDSIGGSITSDHLPYLFKMWRHKYPRGQYLISAVFYLPKMNKWQDNPVTIRLADGKIGRVSLDQKRLYELETISKRITIVMSVGILLAVFLTARKLFDDDLAAVLACLCLALSCHFMFYSKLSCVDIPAFFWFAWAGCFGVYAIKSDNLLLYLATAFCASWSVCTKESVATFNIGLTAGLAVLLVRENISKGYSFGKAMRSLFDWKILSAVVLAVLIFVTLEGFWGSMAEWNFRSRFWESVVEREFKNLGLRFTALLQLTFKGLHAGWGWPFMILLVVSLGHWMVKYRWQLCVTLLPIISFFFLTVLVIGQNLPRFMMCGYAGIAIMMGKTLADWYRFKKPPSVIRHVLPLLVIVPSFICCVCFDLEMKNDTRVRTKGWLRDIAASEAIVGLSMNKGYAPHVWLDGFSTIPSWDSKGTKTPDGLVKIWPDYLVGSDQWPCIAKADKPFFNKMFKGQTDYQKQVQFNRLYFNDDKFIWKYCLRAFKLHPRISPRIMIYKK